MDRSELARTAVEIAHNLALRELRCFGDFEDRVANAGSLAWEYAQTAGPNATPGTIAWFAVRRAGSSSPLHRGKRSIDHPRHELRRETINVEWSCDSGTDPALIVQAQLDFEAWLESLSAKERLIAVLYWNGYRTGEIATVLRWTYHQVWFCRKRLERQWVECQEV